MSGLADRLVALVARSSSLSLPDPARLTGVDRVTRIAIVGATCAGKSTIVDAIRASGLTAIPPRFLTRAPRAGDRAEENLHVSAAEFDARVARGEIDLRWVRPMEAGREERYGFAPSSAPLTVYSANNALCSNAGSVRPAGAFEDLFIIGVIAPDDLRASRLLERSPDLVRDRPAESAYRLADRSENILPCVHVLIDNDERRQRAAPAEAVELIRTLEESWENSRS